MPRWPAPGPTPYQSSTTRDLGWFLLGRLPNLPEHPREFLTQVAAQLYPQGLPQVDAQMRRLDLPNESLFDLA